MKKSVNGLTFEEIFAQRGKEIYPNEMVAGIAYLCTNPTLLNVVFDYSSKRQLNDVFSQHYVFDNGSFNNHDVESELLTIVSKDCFFEATPDQIALLNLYKQNNQTE